MARMARMLDWQFPMGCCQQSLSFSPAFFWCSFHHQLLCFLAFFEGLAQRYLKEGLLLWTPQNPSRSCRHPVQFPSIFESDKPMDLRYGQIRRETHHVVILWGLMVLQFLKRHASFLEHLPSMLTIRSLDVPMIITGNT